MTAVNRFTSLEQQLRDEYGEPGTAVITVSGLTGVGTSTVAEMIAADWGVKHVAAGDFFREQARSRGMDVYTFREKQAAIEEREDTDFDMEWDRQCLMLPFTSDEDVVVEGRLAGALLMDVAPVRVLVVCSVDVAAERIAEREGKTVQAALQDVESRNRRDLRLYQAKYGVDPTNEELYTVVVDNSRSHEDLRRQMVEHVYPQIKESTRLQ